MKSLLLEFSVSVTRVRISLISRRQLWHAVAIRRRLAAIQRRRDPGLDLGQHLLPRGFVTGIVRHRRFVRGAHAGVYRFGLRVPGYILGFWPLLECNGTQGTNGALEQLMQIGCGAQ
jgi:hypothetical protein